VVEFAVIDLDMSEIKRALIVAPRQIPFAMAVALTRTAQAGQGDVLRDLGKSVKLRTDYLTSPRRPGYIRMKPAKKDALEAQVGTTSDLMALEATGGEKESGKAGIQAIPTDAGHGSTVTGLRGPQDLGTLLRSQGKWPKGLLKGFGMPYFLQQVGEFEGKEGGPGGQKKGGYVAEWTKGSGLSWKRQRHLERHGGDVAKRSRRRGTQALTGDRTKWVIFRRMTTARYPIEAVYVFRTATKIPAHWPFEQIFTEVARKAWPEQAEQAVIAALWSDR
jgi:hypothetical protein